jgi:hypothetical protein
VHHLTPNNRKPCGTATKCAQNAVRRKLSINAAR